MAEGNVIGGNKFTKGQPPLAGSGQSSTVTSYTTTSTTGRMVGINGNAFTPLYTGKILFLITGYLIGSGGNEAVAEVYYGTGTPPSQGSAPTGILTLVTAAYTPTTTNNRVPFTLPLIVDGTPGTQYWCDINLLSPSGSGINITVNVIFKMELMA